MSKRGGFPGMGGFGGMNINNLMKEAKKMQADLEKSQTELAAKEFEASAGGGAVTAKVNGQKENDDYYRCCRRSGHSCGTGAVSGLLPQLAGRDLRSTEDLRKMR